MKAIKKSLTFILDMVLPKYCLGCKKERTFLCHDCFKKIKLSRNNTCPSCGVDSLSSAFCKSCRDIFQLDNLLVATTYENIIIRKMIHSFKYESLRDLADPLASLQVKTLSPCLPKNENHQLITLIPIPLHPKKMRQRGYNQAELLGFHISSKLNLTMKTDLLFKTKHTAAQKSLGSLQRRQNIKGTFSVNIENEKFIKNKYIILIDDVTTTFSTLEEAARTLAPYKPAEIIGLVVAKGK